MTAANPPLPVRGTAGRSALAADPTLAGTLALTALTLAAALGMGRLFTGGSHLVPFVLAGVAAHAISWAGRRLGAPLGLTVLAGAAASALVAVWVVLPGTTTFGIPGLATLSAARDELSAARAQFAHVVAPVPATSGFLLAGTLGVGIAGLLADWGAFRARTLFEAAIPSFTLFVFTATLGSSRNRVVLVGLYLVALLVFLLVHQAWLQSASSTWFASRSGTGLGRRLRAGAGIGGVAVLAGLLVGPQLPGVGEPPVLTWRGSDRSGSRGGRTTVSPLVDIRGRLVDQSAVEVFSVRSNAKAYWRLTSLDRFDGQIWSFDDTHRPVRGQLPANPGGEAAGARVVQDFTVGALASIWLPAAYRPERVEDVRDVSYNAALASLVTRNDTSDGLRYRVESVVPRFSAAELDRARPGPAGPDSARFLQLPAIAPSVRRLAQQVAGTGTPFARARALQDFFHRGFTYDLGARPGHDERALEAFLFRTKRGYCEQFAGAYAVLARAVGLPTRVAVGFTQGELGQDGRYHVRGLNAHAWPEVHLDGFGWVAFEPTPGRGAPGAQSYTGLPEAQAGAGDPSTATTVGPAATTPSPAGAEQPGAQPDEPAAGSDQPEPAGAPDRRPSPLRNPLVVGALLVVLAAAGLAGAVPVAKRLRRSRRRSAAAGPAERVLVAWAEACEALAQAGAGRRPADTPDEHARRAAAEVGLPSPAAAALAQLATDAAAASYAAGDLAPAVAARASRAAAAVEASLLAAASPAQRLRWAVDPRGLLGDGRGGPGRLDEPRQSAA